MKRKQGMIKKILTLNKVGGG